jgi:hypothetical protein
MELIRDPAKAKLALIIFGVALVEAYDLSPDTNSILGNISSRSFVQTADNVMIGGFIVQGNAPKRMIVRAIGPELTQYGVPKHPYEVLIKRPATDTAIVVVVTKLTA